VTRQYLFFYAAAGQIPRCMVQQAVARVVQRTHDIAFRALLRPRARSPPFAVAYIYVFSFDYFFLFSACFIHQGRILILARPNHRSRVPQVGCFLHLGSLMNLDFGKVLKDSDTNTGAAATTTEKLPGFFASVPNFTAAVIFFVALWNSWCQLHRNSPRVAHLSASRFTLRYMFANYMVRFLAYDVITSLHFFFYSIVVLAMATVTGECPSCAPPTRVCFQPFDSFPYLHFLI
jgi:hypothetical protein